MQDIVGELRNEGFCIIRGFLPADEMRDVSAEAQRLYQEGLRHPATYRDKNLLFEVLDDPRAQRRVVLQAHWTPWISPYFERLRRDERYFRVLEPLLGRDIRQMTISCTGSRREPSTRSIAITRTRAFATPRQPATCFTAP